MKKLTAVAVSTAFLFGGLGSGYVYQEMAKPAVPQIQQMTDTLRIINGEAYTTFTIISTYTYTNFRRDLQYIKARGITVLHLNQLNGGGSVFEMWGIVNMLQAAIDDGLVLHTHTEGMIASAAVPIFLLGQIRTMGKNAYIMLHSHTLKQDNYQPETMNKMGAEWTEAYIAILLERTTMSLEEINKYLSNDKNSNTDQLWMNYDEAEARGFLTQ